MIPNFLFSRDVVVRESYRLVFVEKKTRLYYRHENEWKRAVLPREPKNMDDYATLVYYGVYNLYFSVALFEKEETSYILIDVDTLDPRVYAVVMKMVADLLGMDVKEAYERVPKYLTAKGYNIVLRTRKPVDRGKLRYFISITASNYRVGEKSLKNYIDYSVSDARFLRVPFSTVLFGDFRRVVPIPGDDLSKAIRWQHSIGSNAEILDTVYEEWVYLPREVEESITELKIPEQVITPERINIRPAIGLPPCLMYLLEKARAFEAEVPEDDKPHLSHTERLFLAVLFKRMFKPALWKEIDGTDPARDMIHWALRHMDDYDPRKTDKYYKYANPELKYSCRRLLSEGICPYMDEEDQKNCPYYKKLWLYYTMVGVEE